MQKMQDFVVEGKMVNENLMIFQFKNIKMANLVIFYQKKK